MDTIRITINLAKDEAQALIRVAEEECRHPREQARFFLRNILKDFIQSDNNLSPERSHEESHEN